MPVKFEITQAQAQHLLELLGNYPAKEVISGIDMLRSLQPIPQKTITPEE